MNIAVLMVRVVAVVLAFLLLLRSTVGESADATNAARRGTESASRILLRVGLSLG